MNAFRKQHSGLTLLEVLLTMAVAGSILVMGFKQYQVFKLDSELRKVAYNLDSLFLAASYYYHANCGSQYYSSGTVPGTLSPWYVPQPGQNVSISIKQDLLKSGYLKVAIPASPLVDSSSGPDQGYTVQYSLVTGPRMVNACSGANCTPVPTQIGTTWDWKIQVGVTFVNTTIVDAAQNILQATCLSTTNTKSKMLVNCSDIAAFMASRIHLRTLGGNNNSIANNNGCPNSTNPSNYSNYMVFERNPAFPMNKPGEGLWGLTPTFLQYYKEQTTYPITFLLTNSHTPEFQYFVCGT